MSGGSERFILDENNSTLELSVDIVRPLGDRVASDSLDPFPDFPLSSIVVLRQQLDRKPYNNYHSALPCLQHITLLTQ